MDEMDHAIGAASGPTQENCFATAYRFPAGEGFRPQRGESWIVGYHEDDVRTYIHKAGWLTGIWRSPNSDVFVSDADGMVHRGPEVPGTPWPHDDLPGVLTGVWGLDEQHVYAWGEEAGSQPVLYAFDGRDWRSMPPPERPLVALHGLSPDLLFGVGDAGFITRWDGTSWTTMMSPDRASLSCVFAVSPDEVYAGGHGRSLHAGSVHGWTRVLQHDGEISAIAHWHGDLWVGTFGAAGLCRLRGGELESIKPKLQLLALDAREHLVYTTTGKVGDSPDGEAFSSSPIDDFAELTEDLAPLWK